MILRSQRESIDTGTAVGQMLTGIFGALAQYEKTLIAERAEVAREAARSRGKQVGRPRAITADQLRAVRAMRESGESMASICSTLNLKRATVYASLAEATP